MNFLNLNAMFRWRVGKSRGRPAMWVKADGTWSPIAWHDYEQSVKRVVAALMNRGVRQGDRVGLIASNSAHWVYCDMAVMALGAVGVVVPSGLSVESITGIVRESEPGMVFTDNEDTAKTILEVSPETTVVLIGALTKTELEDVLTWKEFIGSGDGGEDIDLAAVSEDLHVDDLASILYTSNHEGMMHGIMLSHSNIIHELIGLQQVVGGTEDDVTLLVLPMAHVFGRLIYLLNIYSGVQLALGSNGETLLEDLQAVRPHFLGGVPKLYQRLANVIEMHLADSKLPRRLLNRWALDVGHSVASSSRRGNEVSNLKHIQYRVAERLVLEKIRQLLGGRFRFGISSGAPIGRKLSEWLHDRGILILEAYGLTEACGAIVMNRKNDFRFGTVGKPIEQVELSLSDDGEVLVRGPMVMKGYFKNPEATLEKISRDGWLHTGDVGEVDESGFLRITDRKHDSILTAGGKSIAPQNIEKRFVGDPYISRIVVHGDEAAYIVALVTLHKDAVEKWAGQRGIRVSTYEELCAHGEVKRLIDERMQLHNKELAPFETIRTFTILPYQFSVEGGEISITDRLQRKRIQNKYHTQIRAMYREDTVMRSMETISRRGRQ